MVCKVSSSTNTTLRCRVPRIMATSAKRAAAKKVLQKATKSAISRDRKRKIVLKEYESLRSLIPSVSSKTNKSVSLLEVVNEAIDYIKQLEKQVLFGTNM